MAAREWEDLEREILERTDAIWLEEPEDLYRLRNGIIDSGAGSYGQVFTTLLFVQSENRGLSFNACTALLTCTRDPSFNLDQLKTLARIFLTARAGFLNYCGLHELGTFFQRFLELLDRIESKEAFVRVLQALKTYGVRVHLWTEHVFPWGLGQHMVQLNAENIGDLHDHALRGPWEMVPYLVDQ